MDKVLTTISAVPRGWLAVLAPLSLLSALVLYIQLPWLRSPLRKLRGPRSYNILGSLPQMGKDTHLMMEKWVRQYGPIFSGVLFVWQLTRSPPGAMANAGCHGR